MPRVVPKGKSKSTAVKAAAVKAPERGPWEFIHDTAFWGLAILLFLPPYFSGLFFQPEQERALIFATVLFWLAWLWQWSKRERGFFSHPLDYFVLAFPVVYLISAFQAANYGLAVDEMVKTTLYFMVYWLASRLVRDDKDIVTILTAIYISAVGVSLAGLATATGMIYIKDGFLGARIYSSFQYPNALASYLAAVTFIGLYLWRRVGSAEPEAKAGETALKDAPAALNMHRLYPYLYAAANYLLFAVLLGTKSQGGLLVFSAALALFIVGLPKGNRLPVVLHFILFSVPALLAIWRFMSAVAGNNMVTAWLWILLGLVLSVAAQALYSCSERKGLLQWVAAHKTAAWSAVLLVVLAACTGAGVYISGHGDAVRLLLEDLRLRNATERMYFFQDAMKMFKEHPILGWGGGGWQEAYRAYQSYLYNSNQVHGYYFQIMVEAGLLGLLTILGIWASFLLVTHRLYHRAKENTAGRFLVWTITVAAISIGLHAAIDFDLSLSALTLVLWTLFGFARGMDLTAGVTEEQKAKKNFLSGSAVFTGVSFASFIIILLGGSLALADNHIKQSARVPNYNQGVALLQKASASNPFKPEYHSYLAVVYQGSGKIDEGLAETQKALELSKYNPTLYAAKAELYNYTKKSGEAVASAEKALSLAPFQNQWYEVLARTYLNAGINELAAGNRDTAKQYFEQATQVPGLIDARMATLSETEKKLWKDAPLLTTTPAIRLNIAASEYLLGQWTPAEANLQAVLLDDKNKGGAALWLAVLRDKQGRPEEARAFLEQAKAADPQLAGEYEGLRSLQTFR